MGPPIRTPGEKEIAQTCCTWIYIYIFYCKTETLVYSCKKMYSCLVSLSLYHFPVVCRKLMAEKHKKMETMRNKRGVWAWTKEYLLEERLPSVVFNWAGFCPGKLKAAMKTTPEIMLAVLWNTVGCLCALQYRIHLVQNSADRALQALFRLSSSKVGSTNDDIGVAAFL